MSGGDRSDDKAAAEIVGIYRRHAAAFDRKRGRSLFERAWLDRFLALVRDGGEVLDLGCGMGEPIASHIVSRAFRVTGVDSSAELLALAQARLPDECWIEADMRRLALGRRADGVIAWNSLFHLTPADQRAMFGVFARHMHPGAPLLFTSGPSHGLEMGVMEGERLYHASLDPAEYRRLLEMAGCDVIDYVAEDPTCNMHTVWLARRR